jgi:ABC-type phosphate transport system substrate-binding protein
MWDPATGAPFTQPSTLTVSQTRDLVNQMVHVTWSQFTPSAATLVPYNNQNVDYPVMVAECKGVAPTDPTQCYGAENSGTPKTFDTFGPDNTAYATTAPAGTGALDVQIQTSAENGFLGCSVSQPCSLVIVPSQGGSPFSTADGSMDCNDHSFDTLVSGGGTDIALVAFGSITSSSGSANASCTWAKRIVVPLHFAPTPTDCPFRADNFTSVGSPMLARAMDRWRPGICTGTGALAVGYDSSVNEEAARNFFLAGSNDVGLTTRPAAGTGVHPYTYAPVAISGVAIAYWIDDPNTGQPITNMKLDQRLLAKMITTSYSFGNGCAPGQSPPPTTPTSEGCDNAVDGNPFNMFHDPEFQQLNPTITAPTGVGGTYQIPTVLSGNSDMTFETTRWIGADHDASSFMTGQVDPWQMHVNLNYLGLQYPVNGFNAFDPFPFISHKYSPVYPPSLVASYQALNWDPGTDWELTPDPTTGKPGYLKDSVQIPGTRGLVAIVNAADAAAFRFPVAAIRNHAGRYVTPTASSMATAVRDMTANPDGITRAVNETSSDPAAYPLTMVQYAMVPTGGISKAKAAKIADFLDFAANRGQVHGTSPGQLPDGYLPLPASLRAQALQAASEVRNQTGATPPGGNNHTGGTAAVPGHGGSATTPAGGITPAGANRTLRPAPSPGPSFPGVGNTPAKVAFGQPASSGFTRIVLPLLLIVGGLLALAGPSALVLGRPGARAAIIARLRGIPGPWRRSP